MHPAGQCDRCTPSINPFHPHSIRIEAGQGLFTETDAKVSYHPMHCCRINIAGCIVVLYIMPAPWQLAFTSAVTGYCKGVPCFRGLP